MDKEKLKRLLERGNFVTNNGRILRILNMMNAKEKTLSNLCIIMEDVSTSDFKNSLLYLEDAKYIRIDHPDGAACMDNGPLDKPVKMDLTHSGIELLMGLKDTPTVEA